MSTSMLILVTIVGTLIVGSFVLVLAQDLRRRLVRKRFGDEFDRLAANDGPRAAELELLARQYRYQELELRDLTRDEREAYRRAWTDLQSRFVDDPDAAVASADELVTRLIADLGYETDDPRDQLAQLSVMHAEPLGRYRRACEVYTRHTRDAAPTEDLREALVGYRALFTALLGDKPVVETSDESADGRTGTPAPAQASARTLAVSFDSSIR